MDFVPSGYRHVPPTSDLARMVPRFDPPSLPDSAPPDALDAPSSSHDDRADVPVPPPSPSLVFRTEANDFGLYREYTRKPCRDPAVIATPDLLVDSPRIAIAQEATEFANLDPLRVLGQTIAGVAQGAVNTLKTSWHAPFGNASIFRLFNWFYSGSGTKSVDTMKTLVSDVIKADDFDVRHFDNFSYECEVKRFDSYTEPTGMFSADNGWREGSVKISLPKEGKKHLSEADAPEFEVKGVWYRPLCEVIRSAYEDATQRHFHVRAFKLFRSDSDSTPRNSDERIWSDIYDSNAMIEEQVKIDALPRNPDDAPEVEYAVAPLMFWSDATRLANFGTQSLWPIYLYFGSLSKYMRAKPSMFAAHHLAYMPSVRIS